MTDLSEAEALFDEWVAAGYSAADAMDMVKRSGVLEEAERAERFERMGMSKAAAATAARGRGPRPATDHGRMVETYERMGMTRAAAEIAAKGRDGADGSRPVREVVEVRESEWADNMMREVIEVRKLQLEADELQRARYAREDAAAAAKWHAAQKRKHRK